MSAKLYYYYSDLDKSHCFEVVVDSTQGNDAYINWVWFSMGAILKEYKSLPKDLNIYPYQLKGKKIYEINSFKRSADYVGKKIAIKILKHYQKRAKKITPTQHD